MSTRGIAHHQAHGVVHGGELTERQKQIEQLSIAGVPHAQIAQRLGIKFWTVRRELDKVRDVRAYERMRRTINEVPERERNPR